MPTLIRLVAREDHTSIFGSVYLQSAARMHQRGWRVQFVLFSFLGQWLRGDSRRQARELNSRIAQTVHRRPVRLPLPPARFESLWSASSVYRVYAFGKRLRRLAEGEILLEGNNSEAMLAAFSGMGRQGRQPIVYRCWGLDEEEFLYAATGQCSRDGLPSSLAKTAERLGQRQRISVQRADHIICVSRAMGKYLESRFACPQSKVTVVPCAVETGIFAKARTDRELVRRELGLNDRLVITYCGALQRYQLPKEATILVRRVMDLVPNSHFLAITTDTEEMQRYCTAEGIPQTKSTIVSLPHAEVARYLTAGDIGLLLRESCPVNQVASPVKFGEYLAAGLPVVISDGIGDYSSLVREERLGVTLENAEPTKGNIGSIIDLLRHSADYSVRCSGWAKQLDADRLADNVHQVMQECLARGRASR